jgi:hypothetical protein
MDKISPETRAIYEFLRADFDAALTKASTEHREEVVNAFAKLDSKLDQLSGRIDDVRLAIGVDLDELRGELGVERGATPPTSTPVSPREPGQGPPPAQASGGSSGSEGAQSDLEHRSSGPRYVPPPVRGMHTETSQSRQLVPAAENFRSFIPDAVNFGPRIELPRFDGSNPKLWQSRCEDYFKF